MHPLGGPAVDELTPATVHVVHCIDTEGRSTNRWRRPSSGSGTSSSSTSSRARRRCARLQAGEVDLGGLEAAVQKVVDPHLLAYNDTWDKVDAMLEDCLSAGVPRPVPRFGRQRLGLQLVLRGPRRLRHQSPAARHGLPQRVRPLPRACSARPARAQDGLHFHYHPHSFSHEAHRCATHWWAVLRQPPPDPLAPGDRPAVVPRGAIVRDST